MHFANIMNDFCVLDSWIADGIQSVQFPNQHLIMKTVLMISYILFAMLLILWTYRIMLCSVIRFWMSLNDTDEFQF